MGVFFCCFAVSSSPLGPFSQISSMQTTLCMQSCTDLVLWSIFLCSVVPKIPTFPIKKTKNMLLVHHQSSVYGGMMSCVYSPVSTLPPLLVECFLTNNDFWAPSWRTRSAPSPTHLTPPKGVVHTEAFTFSFLAFLAV